MNETPLITVGHLTKRYGGVVALADMNLSVRRGTIHAVVGENGAGKSTLMKVLAGNVLADGGEIRIEDIAVTLGTPNAARRQGIGIVHQELSLFPERSVLANLFVNREPTRGGLVSLSVMEARSRTILERLGLQVDVRAPLARLSIGERQLVELARVLLEEPRLLILDEPNSALNRRETERLFAVLQVLRRAGTTMLYVSHRLEEVFSITDRVTVTRNGRDVLTEDTAQLTIPQVIEAMIGRQREELFPPALPPKAGVAERQVAVTDLGGGRLESVSFSARSGEVVGLAGLEGSGTSDVLELLFGLRRATGGTAVFPDGAGLPKNPTEAAGRGICLVPADRRRNGLMLEKSILFNIANVAVGARGDGPLRFVPKDAFLRARRQIEALRIKAASAFVPANALSGGNQQKVVIGKWLEIGPKIFLLDDPTRGVDVGAKREIYSLIREMSAAGGIVLFASTELPELIGLCDRILVIYAGRLAGEVSSKNLDTRLLLRLINTGEVSTAATKAAS